MMIIRIRWVESNQGSSGAKARGGSNNNNNHSNRNSNDININIDITSKHIINMNTDSNCW